VRPKEAKTGETGPSVFILGSEAQVIGSFLDPTPYQISGAGNLNTDLHTHQIRIPQIICDGTDVSLTMGVKSAFIINTGTTPIEVKNFKPVRPTQPSTKTTLHPNQSIGYRFDQAGHVEISWNSREGNEQKHITTRLVFDQNHQQIAASCEVQAIR